MKKIVRVLLMLFVVTFANAEEISAYLVGGKMSVDDVKAKLTDAGFEVVGASSFLLPVPNANVAAGVGAEEVVLLSSAVAPNENPPPTFTFLPPS